MICDHIGGAICTTFHKLKNYWKTAEPRFCETLHGFHRILKDMTLPESIRNEKTAPYEISVILTMAKTVSSRIFCAFRSSFGTISDHISQLFQASFSGPQKWKISEWPWLPAEATPDTSQVRGEPPEVVPPSPGDVWDHILYKTLHKKPFGYQSLYIFYSQMKPKASKRGPWDDPGAPPTPNTKKQQNDHFWRTQK